MDGLSFILSIGDVIVNTDVVNLLTKSGGLWH